MNQNSFQYYIFKEQQVVTKDSYTTTDQAIEPPSFVYFKNEDNFRIISSSCHIYLRCGR